ncbi:MULTISPECIES: hypothetical protein [Limnobacter]|mgnify:FL=1|jgi:hypothetical protein|uniref:Uncharacterized protein n=1 Tax=Limnobacter profundi TaxID=2732163 RepID=A0ABX6N391_9BURK|nr:MULTISPECIES: hypothetical protein [Limnobacter]MAG81450.1 hypothetical protein [Sutterellaceae bacterium]MBA4315893.1 hypothetical protein [Alcaligenaceae bacterium]PZO18003.1 MAG: hypothetical protein DCE87_02740 [Betaproteobacteria bacterium]MAZ08078.1 hypothetical protein [Sutterellaceae bacterium]MBT85685.1 hypothetical protein [Sutterellaceae bacterium]|tara:strand:- start:5095 stop:5355 length:261 start_codon:yes stop_codon:yes gene_type:complete
MNEWPENLTGLDLNWNLFETANKALRTTLILLIVLAGIGLAQATNLTTELPTVLVTETTEWLNFSGWFSDGAIGGFDAAGASIGGW